MIDVMINVAMKIDVHCTTPLSHCYPPKMNEIIPFLSLLIRILVDGFRFWILRAYELYTSFHDKVPRIALELSMTKTNRTDRVFQRNRKLHNLFPSTITLC